MKKHNKKCFNCGNGYDICYICDTSTRFSWREVACSLECYSEYLEKINGNLDVVKAELDKTKENTQAENFTDEESKEPQLTKKFKK